MINLMGLGLSFSRLPIKVTADNNQKVHVILLQKSYTVRVTVMHMQIMHVQINLCV